MRRWVSAGLMGLALWPSAALAVQPSDFALNSGRDLMAVCSAAPAEPLYLEALQFCYGYLAGAAHLHRALVEGQDLEPTACPRYRVSRAELARVYLEWARANPDALAESPASGVLRAAAAAWPCNG